MIRQVLYSALATTLILCALAHDARAQDAAASGARITDPYKPDPWLERPGLHQGDWFLLKGYLRVRGHMLHNLDLNRGLQPSSGRPIAPVPLHEPELNDTLSTADLRARLEPSFFISPEVAVHFQLDLLDNLVLGSTPAGFPAPPGDAAIEQSTSQVAPVAGHNALADSIAVKRAYAEILTPIGLLSFGRMGFHWGMGLLAHSGDGLDDDTAFTVDRIGFATSLLRHTVGASYDFNANGPSTASSTEPLGAHTDVDDADDVRTVSVVIVKRRSPVTLRRLARADRWAVDYGLVGSVRWQNIDFPAFHTLGAQGEDHVFTAAEAIPRGMTTWLADFWLRVSGPTLQLEAEAAYLHARVEDSSRVAGVSAPAVEADQFGLVARLDWRPIGQTLRLGVELGMASGDEAPGFGTGRPTGLVRTANGDLDGPQLDPASGDLRVDNFRFHPAYRIDEILWRRIIGTVTDALYARLRVVVKPLDSLSLPK